MATILLALICLLFYSVGGEFLQASESYKAAVVEFAPQLTGGTPATRLLENAHQYVNLIEEAAGQDVQIIVFPEDGLTGWRDATDPRRVEELSTFIPNPWHHISPCFTQNSNFSEVLVMLSCAALTEKLYVAVNLIEREYDEYEASNIYYNTNVVFDKNGAVMARYRKINLFNEAVFTPGNEIVKFQTDFGVTFGIFTCFDISYKFPALEVLADKSVTAIVFPVAWFSESPFWQGLATHHGYAKSNGITLLSANLNGPKDANGGSGIYLPDGRVLGLYVSGVRESKLIIEDVPKVTRRSIDTSNMCQSGYQHEYRKTNVGGFVTLTEDMRNYTFKALNFHDNHIRETVCSTYRFCCTFDIIVQRTSEASPNYIYKLAAFYGSRAMIGGSSVGLLNCGLVACLNETNTSCGVRSAQPPSGIVFEKITVFSRNKVRKTHYQPVAFKHDLQPIFETDYCIKTYDDIIEVNLTTTSPQNVLMAFGIHGRDFKNDGSLAGPVIDCASRICVNIFCLLFMAFRMFKFTFN